MTRHPDVSFVVVAYNEAPSIAATIRSICAQTSSLKWELVVVDDASTDGTAKVARETMRGDDRLRVVKHLVNKGRGESRATGIASTTAPLVAFVDSDIVLPADWLARCHDFLGSNAAVGGIAVPDGDAAIIARISGATPRAVPGSQAITGNNLLCIRSALNTVPFPMTRLGEDFRFARRLLAAGFVVSRVPGLEVGHRERKSFSAGLRWMVESGIDANKLLSEFGTWRMPDFATFAYTTAISVAVIGCVVGQPLLLVGPFMFLGITSLGFTISRFAIGRRWRSWLGALGLSTLFLGTYLTVRALTLAQCLPSDSRKSWRVHDVQDLDC